MRAIFLAFFGTVCAIPTGFNPEEAIVTEFELTLYDLQDDYDRIAEATRRSYLQGDFSRKVSLEKKLGNAYKETKTHLSLYSDIPESIYEKWKLLNRPGDFALAEGEYNKLVEFSNSVEELRVSSNLSLQGIIDTLQSAKNVTVFKSQWHYLQSIFFEKGKDYPAVLQLLQNASTENEQLNVHSYWEMLSDYDDGYSASKALWEEVQPLYQQLHSFVKKRLYNYYNYSDNSNETDSFPVFLTGSLIGDDWSSIADIVLPRPYLLYDAQSFLHAKSSKQIFELAETVATKMGFPRLHHKFWSSSIFNQTTCHNVLLTFCEDKHTEVLTCSNATWDQYLEAHEIILRALLRSLDYKQYPLPELRNSVFDEAVQGLGSFFAVNAMERLGIVEKREVEAESDVYQKRETLLLLTALRVLPKLAFYYTADKWRLDELEVASEDVGQSWEVARSEVQGLSGTGSERNDFLSDRYISLNKPYLSKFLGIFLEFQILNYFKDYIYNEDQTVFDVVAEDLTLFNVIKERHHNSWRDLVQVNFGIEYITAQPLLDYFAPLTEYLENVPSDFITAPLSTTELPTTPTTEAPKKSVSRAVDFDTPTTELQLGDQAPVEPPKENAQPQQQNAGMYIGLGILACVAVVVVAVLVRNKMRRRRKNRRNEQGET